MRNVQQLFHDEKGTRGGIVPKGENECIGIIEFHT
jgi:hypothetical protein